MRRPSVRMRGGAGLDRIGAAAAQQRLHAGHELAHAEGLREVVVGADAERVHLVVLGAARGDDDDRHRDALAPDGLGHGPAVEAGQHEVDDGDVGALVAQLAQAPLPVLRPLDVEPGVAEVRRHDAGDHRVVLDQEHGGHARTVRTAGSRVGHRAVKPW